jgi:hypothetical protein
MQFLPASKTLYCTSWRATEDKGLSGKLICKSSAQFKYPESGSNARLGGDSAVVAQLQQLGGFRVLAGSPHLYVYVNHGKNTCADDHYSMLVRELGISRGLLRRREAELRRGLSAFDFASEDITVHGYNGPTFVLRAPSRDRRST